MFWRVSKAACAAAMHESVMLHGFMLSVKMRGRPASHAALQCSIGALPTAASRAQWTRRVASRCRQVRFSEVIRSSHDRAWRNADAITL